MDGGGGGACHLSPDIPGVAICVGAIGGCAPEAIWVGAYGDCAPEAICVGAIGDCAPEAICVGAIGEGGGRTGELAATVPAL